MLNLINLGPTGVELRTIVDRVSNLAKFGLTYESTRNVCYIQRTVMHAACTILIIIQVQAHAFTDVDLQIERPIERSNADTIDRVGDGDTRSQSGERSTHRVSDRACRARTTK